MQELQEYLKKFSVKVIDITETLTEETFTTYHALAKKSEEVLFIADNSVDETFFKKYDVGKEKAILLLNSHTSLIIKNCTTIKPHEKSIMRFVNKENTCIVCLKPSTELRGYVCLRCGSTLCVGCIKEIKGGSSYRCPICSYTMAVPKDV